jgi:hypothetical protein
MNLKREFNPIFDISDYYIEDIIQRSIRDNILDYNESFIKYDLFELKNKWKLEN